MFVRALHKLFGSRNQRLLKRLHSAVHAINALEPSLQTCSDADLQSKMQELRARVHAGETLDDVLTPCFAYVREAARRHLHMRHYDVQLIGGMVLHQGKIAEMVTGEGKTLVATLPAALNALSGRKVFVVTVNDYLAQRDCHWMQPVYESLGLRAAVVTQETHGQQRLEAYQADIIYVTNNQLGFDYLRDKMAYDPEHLVLRDKFFAIVDEVDSILIDEARTPLIISGPSEQNTDLYGLMNQLVTHFHAQSENDEGDFHIDLKQRQCTLTEEGQAKLESLLRTQGLLAEHDNLYEARFIPLLHHFQAALRAHTLFRRDVDYIIRDEQVVIIDEHTGRARPGQRWAEGLHQAVEAKEGVPIQKENQTLAQITFQNFFRLFDKVAGMTGTADTDAVELHQIYGLEVVVVPPNKGIARVDKSDIVFLSEREKFQAIVEDIQTHQAQGRPILVGTGSIEASEKLSQCLDDVGIEHHVLNAKHHQREAEIIAQAGRPGAVTIATNMAGRGTDIVLGGALKEDLKTYDEDDHEGRAACQKAWQERHDAVLASGGLHVIGTERHESRRIDNQLRGRSGRQGDPGSSQFFLSLDDPLLKALISPKYTQMLRKISGVSESQPDAGPISHGFITRSIENAQKQMEGRNFDIRKQLLEYDNVSNEQRVILYQQRDEVLLAQDLSPVIEIFWERVFEALMDHYAPLDRLADSWDLKGLADHLRETYGVAVPLQAWAEADPDADRDALLYRLIEFTGSLYQEKRSQWEAPMRLVLERQVLLHTMDTLWREHLVTLDLLKQGIGLRGYAQKDPKQEYKRECFELFTHMLLEIQKRAVAMLLRMQVSVEPVQEPDEESYHQEHASLDLLHPAAQDTGVSRNAPCPCGSQKKYKHCHGDVRVGVAD